MKEMCCIGVGRTRMKKKDRYSLKIRKLVMPLAWKLTGHCLGLIATWITS